MRCRPRAPDRQVSKGAHAGQFSERRIEHAPGSKPATAEKLAHRAFLTVQQLLGTGHPVRIYQLLEVAPEVVVHRIGKVGRIRAGNKLIDKYLFIRDVDGWLE